MCVAIHALGFYKSDIRRKCQGDSSPIVLKLCEVKELLPKAKLRSIQTPYSDIAEIILHRNFVSYCVTPDSTYIVPSLSSPGLRRRLRVRRLRVRALSVIFFVVFLHCAFLVSMVLFILYNFSANCPHDYIFTNV